MRALLPLLALASLGASPVSDEGEQRARTGEARELRLHPDRVAIPAGSFTFGASPEDQAAALALCRRDLGSLERACVPELFVGEGPPRTVFLPAFAIDRREVTVADYRRCVRAGRCDPRPLLDGDPRLLAPAMPISRVSWFEAERYCRYAGAALPTELQWERAARGTRPRTFPWGDATRNDRSNHGRFEILDPSGPYRAPVVRVDEGDGYALLAPVGAFPDGASPEGVLDLAGNVMEWLADEVGDEGPQRGGAPQGAAIAPMARRMLRGGSFRQPLLYHRTTAWEAAPPDTRSPEVGFRCVSERVIGRR